MWVSGKDKTVLEVDSGDCHLHQEHSKVHRIVLFKIQLCSAVELPSIEGTLLHTACRHQVWDIGRRI